MTSCTLKPVFCGVDMLLISQYSKTCVKQPLSKRPKIGFEDQISLNAGQKYCRMLQGADPKEVFEHKTNRLSIQTCAEGCGKF